MKLFPIAILCSDIHIGVCPSARSAELDWLVAMGRQLAQLCELKIKLDVPVICAGDIFDRWNASPELINFAIRSLPCMYAVPGQHDLPNHRLDDIYRSAYWTLVEAEVIYHLGPNSAVDVGDRLRVWAFPWGTEIIPCPSVDRSRIHLAVIHRYIWKDGHQYPGADEQKRLKNQRGCLVGYDAAVYGDNHSGFLAKGGPGQTHILNCGTFFRRHIDEISYRPHVGILYSDGHIELHYLNTDDDVFVETRDSVKPLKEAKGYAEFMQQIQDLGSDSLDYCRVLNRYMDDNNTRLEVRSEIEAVLGE